MYQIKHLARSAAHRTERVLRKERSHKFFVGDWKLRRKGERVHEIDDAAFEAHKEHLTYGMESGFIAIYKDGVELTLADMGASAPVKAPEPVAEEEVEDVAGEHDVVELTEEDLMKMARKELNAMAEERELAPADYSNKAEIVDAIIAADEAGEE